MNTTKPAGIDPARTALLLMDYQAGILAAVPGEAQVVSRAAAARDTARAAGMQVVHVRVAFIEQDYAAISARNKAFAPIAANHGLLDGSPPAAIHPDLTPASGEIVVRKTRFGSFGATGLDRLLNPGSYDVLVLAGVSTSGVVLSTLRDAADRDYRLIVLADSCADPDPEVHRVLTGSVFPRQADVIETSEFASLLNTSA